MKHGLVGPCAEEVFFQMIIYCLCFCGHARAGNLCVCGLCSLDVCVGPQRKLFGHSIVVAAAVLFYFQGTFG